MNRTDPIDVLNQLLRLLFRSLPVYLRETQFWTRGGDAPGLAVLQTIAADRKRFAKRLAAAIEQRGGVADAGRFPAAFTGLNDVSLEYILDRAGRAAGGDSGPPAPPRGVGRRSRGPRFGRRDPGQRLHAPGDARRIEILPLSLRERVGVRGNHQRSRHPMNPVRDEE